MSTAKLHRCPLTPSEGFTDETRPVLTAEFLLCLVPDGAQGSSCAHLSTENLAIICMSQT